MAISHMTLHTFRGKFLKSGKAKSIQNEVKFFLSYGLG